MGISMSTDQTQIIETQVGETRVINTYGFHELILKSDELMARSIMPRQKILREQQYEQ